MKKQVFFFVLMFAVTSFVTAQTVVFSDNFDSYTAGSYLAQSNPAWITWNNAPGSPEDGVITTAQAYSAPNSLLITENNDQVYPFGNFTSGHYTVSFNMYVPSTGGGGYFNIQHELLQQWSYECYFYNNGNGQLYVGGSYFFFTYPSDTWFSVLMDVDVDHDQTSLSIDNTVIRTWPFHYTSNDTTSGVNQLAGIDLYAGHSNSGVTRIYYVDDFIVTEINAGTGEMGEFIVTSDVLETTMVPNSSTSLDLRLENTGTAATDFQIIASYDILNLDTTSTGAVQIIYCADSTSPGGFSHATQFDFVAGIPSSSLQAHIGKTIKAITVPLISTSQIPNAKVRVFGMYNPLMKIRPGEMIYEQTFVPHDGLNYITLDSTIVIDGGDLWFGVWLDIPAGTYPFFMDNIATESHYHSCYRHNNGTWDWVDYGHYFISAIIDGTPITPWLSVSPSEGSINAGENVNATVTANSNGMSIGKTYTAKLHCFSTDYYHQEQIVPVSVSVSDVSVNEHNQIEVKIYPNPATDFVQVSSDQIERVEIYNMMGQKVFDKLYDDSHVTIPTNGFNPGTYAVTVTSSNGTVTKQVIVR